MNDIIVMDDIQVYSFPQLRWKNVESGIQIRRQVCNSHTRTRPINLESAEVRNATGSLVIMESRGYKVEI